MFAIETAIQEIRTCGYTLVPDFLGGGRLDRVRAALDCELGAYLGRNNFEGHATERIYTLVARDPVFREIIEDDRVMALCAAFLEPNYLLTGSLAISIHPGETPQPWHNDDAFYPIPRPRPMVSLSTIVAVADFTAANGGTEVIPGSHLWSDAEIGGSGAGQHFAQVIDGTGMAQGRHQAAEHRPAGEAPGCIELGVAALDTQALAQQRTTFAPQPEALVEQAAGEGLPGGGAAQTGYLPAGVVGAGFEIDAHAVMRPSAVEQDVLLGQPFAVRARGDPDVNREGLRTLRMPAPVHTPGARRGEQHPRIRVAGDVKFEAVSRHQSARGMQHIDLTFIGRGIERPLHPQRSETAVAHHDRTRRAPRKAQFEACAPAFRPGERRPRKCG
jgi:hypothetical protein